MESCELSISIESSEISLEDLKEMSSEEQKETMRAWFLENYEDPAERTPYESREGGYIYIWGGPYDAGEELSIFYEYVQDNVIEELAHELSMDCPEWTEAEKPSDYENEYLELILSDNDFFKSFSESIEHIKAILEIDLNIATTKGHLLGLLYISVITAIETYLSDAFINTVINNEDNMRKFVKRNPEFTKKTFKLSEIYEKFENINNDVKSYLLTLLWHNLKKIKPMYKTTLDIGFPEDLDEIFTAINTRHDLVHRNGKNVEGEKIVISQQEVEELIINASQFIEFINNQIDKSIGDEAIDF
jgi:hypothetical protein